MKHPTKIAPNSGLLFVTLVVSIILSVLIAVSAPLQADRLGALFNIYVPVLTGAAAIFISVFALFINKGAFFRRVSTVLIIVNLCVGLYLRVNFKPFFNPVTLQPKMQHELKVYNTADKAAASIKVLNLDAFPDNERLIFSMIYKPQQKKLKLKPGSLNNADHDKVTIRVGNSGATDLVLNKAVFSDTDMWEIRSLNGPAVFPLNIKPGNYADLVVVFTGKRIADRIKPNWWKALFKLQFNTLNMGRYVGYQLPIASTCLPVSSTLELYNSDKNEPVKKLHLTGIWQYRAEGDWEPDLQMQLSVLGFTTKVGFLNFDNGISGENVILDTDEIAAGYFNTANKKLPVMVKKLSSYHGCCLPVDADTLSFYYKGKAGSHDLLFNNSQSGQMLLPGDIFKGANVSEFKPDGPFGLHVGDAYTDRDRNYGKKIGLRVWKARGASGQVIKDAYILGSDYLGTRGTNYDYQDNVYYVANVTPVIKRVK